MFARSEKVLTFASANKRFAVVELLELFYGVMVAQQILVLFVQVRILVEQLVNLLNRLLSYLIISGFFVRQHEHNLTGASL